MVKRYSVSVSDALSQKIDKWKSKINVSQVFQTAMEKLIAEKEDYAKRLAEDESLDAIASRLRKERLLNEKAHFHEGKKVGFEWAKKASYREIQMVLSIKNTLENTSSVATLEPADFAARTKAYKPLVVDILANSSEWLTIQWKHKQKKDVMPYEAIQWVDGWIDGVFALWNEVHDKI